jgi:hypothetical protein
MRGRWRAFLAAALLGAAGLVHASAQGSPHRAFCPPAPALAACTARRLREPSSWRGGRLPLSRAVNLVVRRAFLPATVVLRAPVPIVRLPRGSASPQQVLDRLARERPGYAWRDDKGVVSFGETRAAGSRQNFLNWRLSWFVTGPDVGFDLLVLSNRLQSLPAQPAPLGGMAIEGLRPFIAGRPRRRALRNVTGAQILLDLLRAAPTFFSEVIFPASRPLTHADAVAAIQRWRWVPLTQPPTPPPPKPCGPVRVPPGAGPDWRPPPSEACPPVPHA